MSRRQLVLKEHWPSVEKGSAVLLLGDLQATYIAAFWNEMVPTYESRNYGPLVARLSWAKTYADQIRMISGKRAQSRFEGYLDDGEIMRVRAKLETKGEASIRFGAEKTGHGYAGERGDFCLVGGMIKGNHLTVFYRSLELIGGFAYDLCLFDKLQSLVNRRWRTVTIVTCKAFIFALKGNSNEKLFPKLQRIFE